ncbi:hypothetical protein ON010_g5993 [Phytophthora cinnamomi]|nr:hypothetical protein ON010_g5993 [Phytophthora cinnamomi]
MTHSATYWRVRCIQDSSSDEENTPPNVQRGGSEAKSSAMKTTPVESDDSVGTGNSAMGRLAARHSLAKNGH